MPQTDYVIHMASGETWTEAGLVSNVTGAHYTSDGGPGSTGGSVRFTTTSVVTGVTERVLGPLFTWEQAGVPAGAIVTACFVPSFYYRKVATTGAGASAIVCNHRLWNSSNADALSGPTNTPGIGNVTGGWTNFTASSERPTVVSASQKSTSQVRLSVGLTLTTTSTVNIDIRFDLFTLRITWSYPKSRNLMTFY